MNIKIKGLYQEAIEYTRENAGRRGQKSSDAMCAEKFAKLVVRSCISEVAMMGVVHYENKDIAWAANTIICNLKETFDIENIETRTLSNYVELTPEEIDDIITHAIDPTDALIQTMDKLKEKNI